MHSMHMIAAAMPSMPTLHYGSPLDHCATNPDGVSTNIEKWMAILRTYQDRVAIIQFALLSLHSHFSWNVGNMVRALSALDAIHSAVDLCHSLES